MVDLPSDDGETGAIVARRLIAIPDTQAAHGLGQRRALAEGAHRPTASSGPRASAGGGWTTNFLTATLGGDLQTGGLVRWRRDEMHTYPGIRHGFHNNSTPRYHEPSAELAWERTIACFKKHLA